MLERHPVVDFAKESIPGSIHMNAAWDRFLGEVDNWVTLEHYEGADSMQRAYLEVLNGASPDKGVVVVV